MMTSHSVGTPVMMLCLKFITHETINVYRVKLVGFLSVVPGMSVVIHVGGPLDGRLSAGKSIQIIELPQRTQRRIS